MHLTNLLQPSPSGRLALVSLLLLNNIPSISALDPNCHPGGNFDLTKWRLQLPVGTNGPKQVNPDQLKGCAGYSDPYFYTDATDGTLIFKVQGAPDNSDCVTTPNSQHCRSELREDQPSSWSPFDPVNRLFGDLKVTQNDGEICVGQIHIDDSISTKPVAELYYNSGGDLKMGVQQCRTCSQQRFDIDNVPKGQRFTYEIRYESNKLSVSINGKAFKELTTFDLDGPNSYFKAGNYNQGEGPTEVHFYAINISHSADDGGSDPGPDPGSNCSGAPAIDSDSTLTLRFFGEETCCQASQTTKLGVLDSCHNASAPFMGFNEAVGQQMFGRNIRVYTYEGSNCSGASASFNLTNQPQCFNTGATFKSYKISAS